AIVGIFVVILICLFSAQWFGTDKVGYSFAPIILIWFSVIGGIGVYNLFKHDIKILCSFNPIYIIDYFKRNGIGGGCLVHYGYCCGCSDGHHNTLNFSHNANNMEDKRLKDNIVLHGLIQICTRWISSSGLFILPNDDDGYLALCIPKEIYV
ncbi:hypothetical protein GIB67_020506, partial [Kingdonia uniflora]